MSRALDGRGGNGRRKQRLARLQSLVVTPGENQGHYLAGVCNPVR